mgnify:CR=1 FL=1
MGVALHLDVVLDLPVLQLEWSVGNDVTWLGPPSEGGCGISLGKFQNDVPGHRVPSVVFGDFREKGKCFRCFTERGSEGGG